MVPVNPVTASVRKGGKEVYALLGSVTQDVQPMGCVLMAHVFAQMVRNWCSYFSCRIAVRYFESNNWMHYLLVFDYFFIGWNGKHCTIEGCPSNCNGHGQCKANNALEWECLCDSGWYGAGCNIYLEQDCSDRKDNDGGKYKTTFTLSFVKVLIKNEFLEKMTYCNTCERLITFLH